MCSILNNTSYFYPKKMLKKQTSKEHIQDINFSKLQVRKQVMPIFSLEYVHNHEMLII